MITYKRNRGHILVFKDGIRLGTIRPVDGGFQYFPCMKEFVGEVFLTIGEVKESLEKHD